MGSKPIYNLEVHGPFSFSKYSNLIFTKWVNPQKFKMLSLTLLCCFGFFNFSVFGSPNTPPHLNRFASPQTGFIVHGLWRFSYSKASWNDRLLCSSSKSTMKSFNGISISIRINATNLILGSDLAMKKCCFVFRRSRCKMPL